jgi:molybdenum cofactor cytidylyltransferase
VRSVIALEVAAPEIAAVVLAAGRGERMGAPCKALIEIDGRPMILAAVEAALASRAAETIVVTGHGSSRVRAALADLPVRIIENPDYRLGLSTSLRAGLAAAPATADGVVVLLADMPLIRSHHIDRLIGAFAAGGADICLPVFQGRRGNPVLWGRGLFTALCALDGDTGGRALLAAHAERTRQVEMDAAILFDVDEPTDVDRLQTVARR